ncbi:MAG TPA: hypothetical protein VFV75_08725 [Candidatus Polarisedimenticolaceae bacterium]|nr:hypothetical protein [Candidatus Polarisedimenticolaceae bacterium]
MPGGEDLQDAAHGERGLALRPSPSAASLGLRAGRAAAEGSLRPLSLRVAASPAPSAATPSAAPAAPPRGAAARTFASAAAHPAWLTQTSS